MSEPVGRQAPTVRVQELDDELSLFDSATGTAVALNATARDIWAMVDGEATVEEIVATLARAYRVDPDAIDHDVRAALGQLVAAGFVVPGDQ
jgi:PqqD family protein of HPr-rel-A system